MRLLSLLSCIYAFFLFHYCIIKYCCLFCWRPAVMASALPVAFRTLFTCLFIFMFGFCAKNKFFFFFFFGASFQWTLRIFSAYGAVYHQTAGRVICPYQLPGYQAAKKSLTISLAVSIQYTIVTDGQTDGHRTPASTAITHSVAR